METTDQPTLHQSQRDGQDDAPQELRVVLLGKTGCGKSSLGNTLLGGDYFSVERGMCSGTDRCQHIHTIRKGISLQVTDTPGVCDTHRSETEVLTEVGKSLVVASPGPHVILMALRCDRRFTQEEYDAYVTLKCLFGEEICNHMILVFVGLDCLGSTEQERVTCLQQEIWNAPPLLRKVIDDARGRYFGVNNMAVKTDRDLQADKLMERIQTLVSQNGGHYFSSEFYEDVNEHLRQHAQQRMKEDDVTYNEALTSTKRDVIEEKTKGNFFPKLLDIVGNKVLPVLKKILGTAVALGTTAVSAYCAVM